jgi:hypothetical protein
MTSTRVAEEQTFLTGLKSLKQSLQADLGYLDDVIQTSHHLVELLERERAKNFRLQRRISEMEYSERNKKVWSILCLAVFVLTNKSTCQKNAPPQAANPHTFTPLHSYILPVLLVWSPGPLEHLTNICSIAYAV